MANPEFYIHFSDFFQDLDCHLITKIQQVKDNINDTRESQELLWQLHTRNAPFDNHLLKLATRLKELYQKRDLLQQKIDSCGHASLLLMHKCLPQDTSVSEVIETLEHILIEWYSQQEWYREGTKTLAQAIEILKGILDDRQSTQPPKVTKP
jgi:DNA repair exonuclease SbcCD ATPase subunit